MQFLECLLEELVVFAVVEDLSGIVIVPEDGLVLFNLLGHGVGFEGGLGEVVFCSLYEAHPVEVVYVIVDDVLESLARLIIGHLICIMQHI